MKNFAKAAKAAKNKSLSFLYRKNNVLTLWTNGMEIKTQSKGPDFAIGADTTWDVVKDLPKDISVHLNNTITMGFKLFETVRMEDMPSAFDSSGYLMPNPDTLIYKNLAPMMSDDVVRPLMNSVAIDHARGLAVATDAWVLGAFQLPGGQDWTTDVPKEEITIIPAEAVKVISKFPTPISARKNDKYATFEWYDLSITCRLVDGVYPRYNAVIPRENKWEAKVEKKQFLAALKPFTDNLSKKKYDMPAVIFDGEKITHYLGEVPFKIADQILSVDKNTGDDFRIAFNPFYMEKCLKAHDETIVWKMKDPRCAITMESKACNTLIMPMRIN